MVDVRECGPALMSEEITALSVQYPCHFEHSSDGWLKQRSSLSTGTRVLKSTSTGNRTTKLLGVAILSHYSAV